MPDPRKIFNLEGVDAVYATYKYDSTIVYDATKAGGSAQVGLAVTVTASQTVGLTQDANSIEGKLILVEDDGYCNVQTGGYCTLPGGNAATLTPGTKAVGALGAASARGYIRSAASAADALVAKAIIDDASDATNVLVNLG